MGICLLARVVRAQCVVLVLCGAVGGAVAPKKGISVAKCCALNATLTSDNKCQRAINSSWDLRVFQNGTFRTFSSLPPKWTLKEGVQPQCAAPVLEAVALRSAIPFINGYLMSVRFQKRLAPSQFCLDYEYVMFCPEAPEQSGAVLVNKCCGSGAVFSDTNSSCVLFPGGAYDLDLGPNQTLGAGFPECSDEHAVAGRLHDGRLHPNGSLQLNGAGAVLGPANYCLEHILEHAGGGSPSIITCRRFLGGEGPPPSLKLTIYPIGFAISAIFLAATLAAGSLLPSSHHVLHWRCQTNHVACLLVGDVLLCITQVAGGHFPFWPCFLIAVAMHFVFLAAFFWLNTMCFNIWWTFRDLRPQSTEKSQERIRLYLYEAYAWGVPFVVVFVGAVADLATPAAAPGGFLRPRFAWSQCWFGGDSEILTYFFGPMGTLLAINLLLFALTARELTCGLWKRELVKSTTERAALGRVCAKLVVVMGVSWIMDVISWFAGGPDYVWYFTDIVNCLQGVFIFIVVGCQPQVLSAVKRSWHALRNREGRGLGAANDRHSSSSQGLPSVGGDTLTHNSTVTNAPKSPPLETNC